MQPVASPNALDPAGDPLAGLPSEPVARLDAIISHLADRSLTPEAYMQLGSEGYRIAEDLGRGDLGATCIMMMAKGNVVTGNFDQAYRLYQQAERAFTLLEDNGRLAQVWLGLGSLNMMQGHYMDGVAALRKSLALSRQAGAQETESSALRGMGMVHHMMGDYDEAIRCFLRALTLEGERKNPQGVADVNIALARISADLGDNEQALAYVRDSLEYFRATGNLNQVRTCLMQIGDIQLALGEYGAALASYRETSLLLEGESNLNRESAILSGLGRIYLKMGDLESASEAMQRNLELLQSTGIQADTLEVLFDLAQLYMRQGKTAEAFDTLSRSRELAEELGMRPMLAEIHQLFSEYYEAEGDSRNALEHYREFHRIDSEVASGETGRKLQRMQAQLEMEKQSASMRLKSERMEHELELARQVQQSLLPAAPPEVAGLDVAAVCVPALEVGGDYYDYFPTGEQSLGIAIGDVSGKGLPAAIYMTLIKGVICSHALPGVEPNELLTSVNHHLHEIFSRGKFASMIYATIDLERMELRYASAGQNPPLLIHDRERISPERTEGMALGLARSETFAPSLARYVHPLRRGDTIVFYTDGFSEAMNERREEYGDEQLIESALRHSVLPDAMRVLEAVGRDVEHFTGSAPRHDDMTMIVVKIR